MSKVFRSLIFLFCLAIPSAAFSTESGDEEVWETAMEWAGHPVFREKRIVRNLVSSFYKNEIQQTETAIRESLDRQFSKKKLLKAGIHELIRKDLDSIPDLAGISYELPELGSGTILKEETDFPETFQSFSYKNGTIKYFFRSRQKPYLENWENLKLLGSFYAFTEAGALLLCKEKEDAPIQFRDIRELRSHFQERKKRNSSLELFHENGIYLFYFPSQNLFPYYILLISKGLLSVFTVILVFLYSKRFWTFLKDQNKRSFKAQTLFLRDKQKIAAPHDSDQEPIS
ncbi:hypothetical protein LEP1GSC058_2292 [Leptospira fainei serovar Hurstbridge str. BUT 6]|uniref:Uncharacterized protein n=1 Tax=Leptospira fainei serovar Hurstbridge str. BUT 6 TaxID=1193011 RepID=S3VG56_9LEPT|nr:hypothetical protein [Leptospira fainei]EPG75455.1 hypothetical protein LEP1GSC058_2292 [Leptospira fainei serovar Hurstbridge str. BUT 6]